MIPPGESLEGFAKARYLEWGDFVNQPYELIEVRRKRGWPHAICVGQGTSGRPKAPIPLW